MTVGSLLKALEPLNSNDQVILDFCNLGVVALDSWRGIYAELALAWTINRLESWDVGDLRTALKNSIGATFVGYKGGDFVMNESTPVHIDAYGEYTDTHIIGVQYWEHGGGITLLTGPSA